MKLTPSELFTDISDGVFVFSGFISLLIGFSFGLLFNKLLTDLYIVSPADNDAIFDYIFNDYINPSYDLWQQEI